MPLEQAAAVIDRHNFDLVDVRRYEGAETIDDSYCTVALVDGRPVNVELLTPRDHLDLLAVAAERCDLDADALLAAAQAALAAPDRPVSLTVGRLAAAA